MKSGNGWIIALLAVMVFAIVGFGYMSMNSGTGATNVEKAKESSGDCDTAPSITLSAVDSALPGTAVTVGSQYIVDGVFRSGYTATVGDKVKILANASSWIDTVTEEKTIKCGVNSYSVKVKDYAAPTVTILERSTTLTDAATDGAVNASSIANGASQAYTVEITPAKDDSTGDLIYVVELSANTNVSDVTLTPVSGGATVSAAAVPTFYSNTLTSPYVKAFKISNMDGAVKRTFDLNVQANTKVFGSVYTTFYVFEPAIDTTGVLIEGDRTIEGRTYSGVEKKDGTTTYEATFDYDFYIKVA